MRHIISVLMVVQIPAEKVKLAGEHKLALNGCFTQDFGGIRFSVL